MRKSFYLSVPWGSLLLVCGFPILTVLVFSQPEYTPRPTMSSREESLRAFLREHVREKQFPDEDDTRYAKAFVDLNGDGREEAIVFLMGRWWCGSGGCPTLVLTPQLASWKVVARILTTSPPIRVLRTRSKGWRSITVWTHDPEAPPYEAELQFDGETYPLSPTTPVGKNARGRVIVSSAKDASSLN